MWETAHTTPNTPRFELPRPPIFAFTSRLGGFLKEYRFLRGRRGGDAAKLIDIIQAT